MFQKKKTPKNGNGIRRLYAKCWKRNCFTFYDPKIAKFPAQKKYLSLLFLFATGELKAKCSYT